MPYDWRENLAGDVIAGVTLAVMQVLSGMETVFKYRNLIYHISAVNFKKLTHKPISILNYLFKEWLMHYSQMFQLFLESIVLYFLLSYTVYLGLPDTYLSV